MEITCPDDPEKTEITGRLILGKDLKVFEIKFSRNEILLNLIETRNFEAIPISLPLKFIYRPEVPYAPIHEVMSGRNQRIKSFYHRLWFGQESMPLQRFIEDICYGGKFEITTERVAQFLGAIQKTTARHESQRVVPLDFAIVIAWKALMKPLFIESLDEDLLKLVHLSNEFRTRPGSEPLQVGDVLYTTSKIEAITIQSSGKVVEVCCTIVRNAKPIIDVISRFHFRGSYSDHQDNFRYTTETPTKLSLTSMEDVSLLLSRKWFQLSSHQSKDSLLGKELHFELQSATRFESQDIFNEMRTHGRVWIHCPTQGEVEVGRVLYKCALSSGNPVRNYLERHGKPNEQAHKLDTNSGIEREIVAPASNASYALASGDYNPIHVSSIFARYLNLDNVLTHGMYSSAAISGQLHTIYAEGCAERLKTLHCKLVGMVYPEDELVLKSRHVGMIQGKKIVTFTLIKKQTEETVVTGEARIDQARTCYVFTGQGSQQKNMGMKLFAESAAARQVWERADNFCLEHYGKFT